MEYIVSAILAALLYALYTPGSKILLSAIPSMSLAGLSYLGAGIGMSLVYLTRLLRGKKDDSPSPSHGDIPALALMILLDALAPIFLLLGLSSSQASAVSLLNNLEIIFTSLLAFLLFKERIGWKSLLGIILIFVSGCLLCLDFSAGLSASWGLLWVVGACLCWGLENNLTRKLSSKSPHQIVIVKGLGSGSLSLFIGFLFGERISLESNLGYPMLLGFCCIGLSVYFYVLAQRGLGASKTSAYYACSPFLGSVIGYFLFGDSLDYKFLIAFVLMAMGCLVITISELRKSTPT
ncbi:MAG: DMT family transporter [Bacillota bacterium]|nr:DMT family transporter [Bacillota bacterium]